MGRMPMLVPAEALEHMRQRYPRIWIELLPAGVAPHRKGADAKRCVAESSKSGRKSSSKGGKGSKWRRAATDLIADRCTGAGAITLLALETEEIS
jgi:hypothetical protein